MQLLTSRLRTLCSVSQPTHATRSCLNTDDKIRAATLEDVPTDALIEGIFETDAIALRGLAGVSKQFSSVLQVILREAMDVQRLFRLGSAETDRVASWQFCGVTDRDIIALVHWLDRRHHNTGRSPLSGMEELQLNDNAITDRGIYELTSCPALGSLRSISIANNRISNTGLVVVAEAVRRKSGAFAKLNTLNVRGNGFADAAVDDAEFTAWLREACQEAGCDVEEDGMAALERHCKQSGCYLVSGRPAAPPPTAQAATERVAVAPDRTAAPPARAPRLRTLSGCAVPRTTRV